MNKIKIAGLRPLQKDERDLHVGGLFDLPDPKTLPPTFSLGDAPILNQGTDQNDDFCAAYGSVGMAYLQDRILGSPEWVFAASKAISGDPESFGQDMRTIFKTWVEYGSPRKEQVTVPTLPDDRRYFKNYDASLSGDELKKKTYVTCKANYDAYDNIRSTIFKFRDEKRAVGIGVVFAWALSDVDINTIQDGGFGHFLYATGWNEKGLEVVNSYGKEAGENGKHYISREVINHFVGIYGAYTMIDLPIEQARQLAESRKKNWLIEIIKNLWDFFLDIFNPDRLRIMGAKRSPRWSEVRRSFLVKRPECAVCGKRGAFLKAKEIHHLSPFHKNPALELLESNLITLCREHHFFVGHLNSWRSWNEDVRENAEYFRNKITNRP